MTADYGQRHYGALPGVAAYLPVFNPGIVLEVDWNNDGDFSDAYENLGAYLTAVEAIRGKDYASQLVASATAGTLRARLRNDEGTWSSFNVLGPLYGNLLPNRKVRLRSNDKTLWTGFTSGPPAPFAATSAVPEAELNAVGPLAILGNPNAKISPPAMTNASTGAIINAILDAAGWPALARQIETGNVVLGHWAVEDIGALEALQEIVEVEGGELFEGTNWDIIFHSRYHRFLTTRSLVSQASFSDDINAGLYLYDGIAQDDPLREIFNYAEVTVTPLELQAIATVWTYNGSLALSPGETKTLIATAAEFEFVDNWITPTVGPGVAYDLNQVGVPDANIGISFNKKAKTMEISITNTHATLGCFFTKVTARAAGVKALDTFTVKAEDVPSENLYTKRTWPFSSPWLFNEAWATASAQYVVSEHKDPHPSLGMTFKMIAPEYWLFLTDLKEGDRISVVSNSKFSKLGINNDFYIEFFRISMAVRALTEVEYRLSAAKPNPNYWRLDIDQLGVGTKLGY